MSQNTVKLQADWNNHYASPVEPYKYTCVEDLRSVFLYLLLLQYALALLDLYSQVSLSLKNPTPSRLSIRNMEVDSSYSYYACRGQC